MGDLAWNSSSRTWLLVVVAAVSGGMLLWPLLRRGAGGPWVNTFEATQLINRSDALVVDLRGAEDYAKGHILGAKNIPLADLERRAGELDKHKAKPLIVHCGARQPRRRRRGGAAQEGLRQRAQSRRRLCRLAAGRPAGGEDEATAGRGRADGARADVLPPPRARIARPPTGSSRARA